MADDAQGQGPQWQIVTEPKNDLQAQIDALAKSPPPHVETLPGNIDLNGGPKLHIETLPGKIDPNQPLHIDPLNERQSPLFGEGNGNSSRLPFGAPGDVIPGDVITLPEKSGPHLGAPGDVLTLPDKPALPFGAPGDVITLPFPTGPKDELTPAPKGKFDLMPNIIDLNHPQNHAETLPYKIDPNHPSAKPELLNGGMGELRSGPAENHNEEIQGRLGNAPQVERGQMQGIGGAHPQHNHSHPTQTLGEREAKIKQDIENLANAGSDKDRAAAEKALNHDVQASPEAARRAIRDTDTTHMDLAHIDAIVAARDALVKSDAANIRNAAEKGNDQEIRRINGTDHEAAQQAMIDLKGKSPDAEKLISEIQGALKGAGVKPQHGANVLGNSAPQAMASMGKEVAEGRSSPN